MCYRCPSIIATATLLNEENQENIFGHEKEYIYIHDGGYIAARLDICPLTLIDCHSKRDCSQLYILNVRVGSAGHY
jgi:hypothetical protein